MVQFLTLISFRVIRRLSLLVRWCRNINSFWRWFAVFSSLPAFSRVSWDFFWIEWVKCQFVVVVVAVLNSVNECLCAIYKRKKISTPTLFRWGLKRAFTCAALANKSIESILYLQERNAFMTYKWTRKQSTKLRIRKINQNRGVKFQKNEYSSNNDKKNTTKTALLCEWIIENNIKITNSI